MEIFSSSFSKLDSNIIISDLKQKGFFCFEKALSDEFVNAIKNSVEKNREGLNKNWAHGILLERQFFFTHMLAISKEFLDYVCHAKTMQICRGILGDLFRLKAMRYYETQGGHHMQWHTDNKTDKNIADIPGLIFIVYLTDVEDGEFQYVSGSHEWSGQKAYSDYSDEEIESKYKDKIISFKKPKGSIVIYNTYGIHRAKPVKDKSYLRKSLFFQVDNEIKNAEPILLNPSYCVNLSPEMQAYLGFGLNADYEIFPNSDLKHHPLSLNIIKKLAFWIGYRMARYCFDSMPQFCKNKLKERRRKSL